MQFIDETKINVIAGKGGAGACSFLRLKFMPFGGPDGGNGGNGGSVFAYADPNLNTLADFHYQHHYQAADGEKGGTRQCAGKKGDDLILHVPVGTIIYDDPTNTVLADLATAEQISCLAKGGRHGLGNACFKSSTNRAPRRTIAPEPGEARQLRLELNVVADVGLIGFPNAGKSTLVRTLSAATPKVADYPFTTLHPILGVVRVGPAQSFVLADLPGLIQGASTGAGLGIRFLKHATRTRLLLHIVDIAPTDGSNPIDNIQQIQHEIAQFSQTLVNKPCCLVFNKIDLLPPDIVDKHCAAICNTLQHTDTTFTVSGLAKQGLDKLIKHVLYMLRTAA